MMSRRPSGLRFLSALGISLDASYEKPLSEFNDKMADEGNDVSAMRCKVDQILSQ
jgi:hypothetical protein